MSWANATAERLLVACVVVAGCQDPAQAPIPLPVTSEPDAQVAGGVITLTSQQFVDLVLHPSPDTLRPNRWTNFAVIVGEDTADSWRVGPTQIAFRVPPIYTGNYEAVIEARGYDQAHIAFFGVGLAFPLYWGGLNPYTNVSTGAVLPARGILVAEGSGWPGFAIGYGLIDLQSRALQMPTELMEAGSNRVKMYTPGPSYRANHFIFDLSPLGSAAAKVWRPDPWTLVDSIPCGDPRGSYTAVDLAPGTCLALVLGGHLVRNGTDTLLLPAQTGVFDGQFRLAPGGKWVVVRTQLSLRQFGISGMSWPVIDRFGSISYTIDTLFHVSGAAFSGNGDTLFLTASVRDTAARNDMGARFALVVLEAATGRVLAARPFASDRALQDVVVDPVRPRLYVGGIQTERSASGRHFRQYLTVLDRGTLDVVADMPAPSDDHNTSVHDATLVYLGSAGRVSVVGWCGVDCGGLWVFTFDLP
jgi:hypothetical protein